MSEEREYTFAQAFGGSRDMCCMAVRTWMTARLPTA